MQISHKVVVEVVSDFLDNGLHLSGFVAYFGYTGIH